MDSLKRALKPVLRVTYQPLMRLTRGLTLGVRCAVIDAEGKVLLIRHTYAPGWTFPGGGVERGETALQALARELDEEAGIALGEAPRLHGIFANFRDFPGDHILLYVARDWRQASAPKRNMEIAEHAFFAPDAPPASLTPGTARRFKELFSGAPPSSDW